MDATEAQLKFGASLTNSLDMTGSSSPVNNPVNTNTSGKHLYNTVFYSDLF